jgi:hypothetical protein
MKTEKLLLSAISDIPLIKEGKSISGVREQFT